jgi:hypothetical protein
MSSLRAFSCDVYCHKQPLAISWKNAASMDNLCSANLELKAGVY